jgi:hypothetical protein
MEISVLVIIVLVLLFLISIYTYGRKDGYQKGYDNGYKRATDELDKIDELADRIENRLNKRDYYG